MDTMTIEVKGESYSFEVRNGWPYVACWKCGGAGWIKGYEFSDNARCWKCMTAGGSCPAAAAKIMDAVKAGEIGLEAGKAKAQLAYAKVLRSRELARARAEVKRQAGAVEKAAAFDVEQAEYRAGVAELFEAQPLAVDATYFDNMTYQAPEREGDYFSPQHSPLYRQLKGYEFVSDRYDTRRPLSARMLEIAAETTAKLIGGGAPALAAGRQTLVGVMGKAKPVETYAGYQTRTTWKVTVTLDSGQRVYGSIPRAIEDAYFENRTGPLEDWTQGKRVEFTATVEPSDDDPTFGFYSRPAPKARLLEEVSA